MNPAEVLAGAQATMSADRVFGTPFERDGATILPVASIGSRFDAARRAVPSSTSFRVTLLHVADNQNITLSVPRALLKRVKRVAADRDTSVSALMTEALDRLANEDRRYSVARKRALAALKSARSLGTQGRRTWSRAELHER